MISDISSIELLPKDVENIAQLPESIRDIYVPMLSLDALNSMKDALKHIQDQGRCPIPHIAARKIAEKDLDSVLGICKELNINRALFIAGDSDGQHGSYSSVLDVFNTGALKEYGIAEVDIAGHPEGNPDDKNSHHTLMAKLEWSGINNIKTRIVTQWSFDTDSINSWINQLKKDSVNASIHIGIPGPATIKTLLAYAKLCGVKTSAKVMRQKGINLGKLLFVNEPDELIKEIKGHTSLHLFPFGGMSRTIKWLEKK